MRTLSLDVEALGAAIPDASVVVLGATLWGALLVVLTTGLFACDSTFAGADRMSSAPVQAVASRLTPTISARARRPSRAGRRDELFGVLSNGRTCLVCTSAGEQAVVTRLLMLMKIPSAVTALCVVGSWSASRWARRSARRPRFPFKPFVQS
jgi:hypothetical protein